MNSPWNNEASSSTVLLLSGRGWKVRALDWNKRIAYVETSGERGRSRWSGASQGVSFELCRSIRSVLVNDGHEAEWSRRCRSEIDEVRSESSEEDPFLRQDLRAIYAEVSGG